MPRRTPDARPRLTLEAVETRDTPAGLNWTAVGAAAGGEAVARIVDAGGNEVRRVVAFPGFTGGVSAALGDVTGDGVPDLVAAAGPGGGPRVRVFDGATGAAVRDFMAFDPAFAGGVSVAVADLDRDGFADVVAGAGAGGGPHVRAFSGKDGGVLFDRQVFDTGFMGGVNVAAADVDGDERADIVVGAGAGGGPRVEVFSAAGDLLRNFLAFDPTFRGGVSVAAADLDADAFADVVVGAGPGGGPHVVTFDGRTGAARGGFFAFDPAARTGARVGTWFATGSAGANICALPGDGTTGPGADFDGRTFAATTGPGITGAGSVGGVAVADGDAVQDWVGLTLRALKTTATGPTVASRVLAIESAAVYDAVNSIVGGYDPYLTLVPGAAGADVSAAVASAARDTLVALFPTLAARFDAALAGQLAAIPDGPPKAHGVAVGRAAAAAILAARANDGSAATGIFVPGSAPGQWVPTPPAFRAPLTPKWGQVTPFAVDDVGPFRAPLPPPLASAEYAAALDEVKQIGSKTSAARAAEQTQIALFWAAIPGPTPSPPGMWGEIALRLSRQTGLSVAENARLFARLNLALADSAIASWAVKYEDNFWRPVTAIRAAETDGNPDTTAEPAWEPLLVTPNFPGNTSGHSTFSAAAAAVLGNAFGPDRGFTVSSDELPGVVRAFDSFAAAAAEAGMSRIYGGIHFPFDNTGGLASGKRIGEYVAANLLKPRGG